MKINYKPIVIYPVSTNLSQFPQFKNDNGELEPFDVGDGKESVDKLESNLHADALLLQLLSEMDSQDKIILLYQVLREAGYNLNHGDCAKTLSYSLAHYMSLVKEVKRKAVKIIQAEAF